MTKLQLALKELVDVYGAEKVESVLHTFEPFKSRDKESSKLTRKWTRSQHKRTYRDVRSREALLDEPVVTVHVNSYPDDARFSVTAISKGVLSKSRYYTEPTSRLADFVEWLTQQGFIPHPEPMVKGTFLLEFVHEQRYMEQEARIAAIKEVDLCSIGAKPAGGAYAS